MEINRRHGGPYDRGTSDSYYRRPFKPHYFVGATYLTKEVELGDMTVEEIVEYTRGFNDNQASQNFKEWE